MNLPPWLQSILDVFTPAPLDPEKIPTPPGSSNAWNSVTASSFADPADVSAFRAKKAEGLSDEQAFKFGDNGIGYWGDPCYAGTGPRCALPPEVWKQHPSPRLAKVQVSYGGKVVTAELSDTMPHIDNIRNGARLDMSPDLCAALGVKIPAMAKVEWRWVA